MPSMPAHKYRAFQPVDLKDRTWPDRVIDAAPMWCSVDLRDGNQALVEPMGSDRKLRLYNELIKVGFKEIEVGFPSASQADFDFVRAIIEAARIPDDLTIQVLTQSREELIRRTFAAIEGARRTVVHLYNSTSELQRRVVFRQDRAGIVGIALSGARLIAELTEKHYERFPNSEIVFEYSPESFTGTELDFAVEICERVVEVLDPIRRSPIILNLPATVELSTPNIYADQVEWFGRHIKNRQEIILSVHPHNDRGTAVAAAELAVMAGADRVEGTLFGNGERTGNVDIVTLALNLFTQGVDPKLTFSRIDEAVKAAEFCTRLPVHPRHPYAGELVFTAFSGSHQDAINKGLAAHTDAGDDHWEVPYLPIDPKDVGRSYEAVIRINSQSGKGGIAYVMEQDKGLRLPRGLQQEFSRIIQRVSETTGGEVTSRLLWERFQEHYLSPGRLELIGHRTMSESAVHGEAHLEFHIRYEGHEQRMQGRGTGPVAAFIDAMRSALQIEAHVVDYSEHALRSGESAEAAAYAEVRGEHEGDTWFGVGVHRNIVTCSLLAITSAVNRMLREAPTTELLTAVPRDSTGSGPGR